MTPRPDRVALRRSSAVDVVGSLRERRPTLVDVRVTWWAHRALRRVRRDLPRRGLEASAEPPSALSLTSTSRVEGVLRVERATCLERSLVLQRWLRSHDHEHAVVIGVVAPGEDFAAHAWLQGYDPGHEGEDFVWLTQVGLKPVQRAAPAGDGDGEREREAPERKQHDSEPGQREQLGADAHGARAADHGGA